LPTRTRAVAFAGEFLFETAFAGELLFETAFAGEFLFAFAGELLFAPFEVGAFLVLGLYPKNIRAHLTVLGFVLQQEHNVWL